MALKFWIPDSGTGLSQLVPVYTKRSATLIEIPTNCKQNVHFQFGFKATKRMPNHRACSRKNKSDTLV